MTDKEVVEGAERMARVLMSAFGFDVAEDVCMRTSTNPRSESAWRTVTAMLDAYNGTDLQSAVDSMEDDDVTPQANVAKPEPETQPVDVEVLDWLETEVSGVSCWHHGSPSYEHDANWMKDRVLNLIREAKKTFARACDAAAGEPVPYILTWRERLASLDKPTDLAEAQAAKMEAADLRRALSKYATHEPSKPVALAPLRARHIIAFRDEYSKGDDDFELNRIKRGLRVVLDMRQDEATRDTEAKAADTEEAELRNAREAYARELSEANAAAEILQASTDHDRTHREAEPIAVVRGKQDAEGNYPDARAVTVGPMDWEHFADGTKLYLGHASSKVAPRIREYREHLLFVARVLQGFKKHFRATHESGYRSEVIMCIGTIRRLLDMGEAEFQAEIAETDGEREAAAEAATIELEGKRVPTREEFAAYDRMLEEELRKGFKNSGYLEEYWPIWRDAWRLGKLFDQHLESGMIEPSSDFLKTVGRDAHLKGFNEGWNRGHAAGLKGIIPPQHA